MTLPLQYSRVMFDVDNSEVRSLADGSERSVKREGKRTLPVSRPCASAFPGLAVAAGEDKISYVDEINERANKQTHVMEEILSHHCEHPGGRKKDTVPSPLRKLSMTECETLQNEEPTMAAPVRPSKSAAELKVQDYGNK